jgi:GNAT superfamily N-acetyltransferase
MKANCEPLDSKHIRNNFDCGEEILNTYLIRYARQDMGRHLAKTFVATNEVEETILGYYTLCSGALSLNDIPKNLAESLPKYQIPVARLARLAVSQHYQGQGWGRLLLIDALDRTVAASQHIGIHAILIDAKHEEARKFYEHFGFHSLISNPLTLFSPLKELIKNLS